MRTPPLDGTASSVVIGSAGPTHHSECAEKAGLTVGSFITAVGSTSVDSTATLGNALHVYKPGASVAVTWVDGNGASHTKTLTLTTGPNI